MLDQYEKITSTYEKLDELQLPFDKPVLVGIEWNGVLFEFLIRLKKSLLICLCSAQDEGQVRICLQALHIFSAIRG